MCPDCRSPLYWDTKQTFDFSSDIILCPYGLIYECLTNQIFCSGVKVRISGVKPSSGGVTKSSVSKSSVNFFNDERINKLLENLSAIKSDQNVEKRKIVLIQKTGQSTSVSSREKVDLDVTDSSAANRVSKKCLSMLATPKCSGINLVSRFDFTLVFCH